MLYSDSWWVMSVIGLMLVMFGPVAPLVEDAMEATKRALTFALWGGAYALLVLGAVMSTKPVSEPSVLPATDMSEISVPVAVPAPPPPAQPMGKTADALPENKVMPATEGDAPVPEGRTQERDGLTSDTPAGQS